MSKVPCEAGIYVIESLQFERGDENEVVPVFTLFRKDSAHAHTHNQSRDIVYKLSPRVKNIIIEQYVSGRKPKSISFGILDDPSVAIKDKPSYKQVVRVVENYKRNQSGVQPLNMRQLTKFVEDHKMVPIDEDKPFIVNFERSPKTQKTDKFFRLFVSTRCLL